MDITKNMKSAGDGIWVDWRDGAKLKLRMSPKLLRELRRDCSVNGILDEDKFQDQLTQKVVLDWSGIEFDGKEFPCTEENKRMLMDNVLQFATFVDKTCMDLENAKEAELKNS